MIDRLPSLAFDLPHEAIADYCRRWKILKLEVFGSILRDDFGPDSDVDFLVSFDPALRLTLFDLVHAQTELSSIVGRPVDLIEREPIEKSENWIRRRSILDNTKIIYVA